MKKQLIAIGLASVLTAPSVALADATIYGSLRTGLEFKSGTGAGDATVGSFTSRFGLKGSSEVSEGLTASFQIEEGYDSATATAPDAGRVSKVALSGGFGTLALGHLWTATGNHYYLKVAPTTQYATTGGATFRASKVVSYSSSVGAVSFQIDRHTDANDVATVEFGASASAGPVNVGFGYWGKEDSPATSVTTNTTTTTYQSVDYTEADGTTTGEDGTYTVTDVDGTVTTTLTKKGVKVGNVTPDVAVTGATITSDLDDGKAVFTQETKSTPNPKTSFTGFYVSSSLAGMNLTVGVGSVDHGVPNVEQVAVGGVTPKDVVDESQTDVSIIALTGSVGDSGVSYAVQMSDSDKTADATTGVESDPSMTVINLTSVLGGGASLFFEHSARKGALPDKSLIALKVDF